MHAAWDKVARPCCRAVFEARGVSAPYAWQAEFIAHAEDGGNVLFVQPTSAGKTLVVEALLINRMVEASRASRGPAKALYVVPYQSLAREKAASLQAFADHHDFVVECFQGAQGKVPLAQRTRSIIVATVEKAGRIVASLVAEKRMHELKLVVADEIHFIGEPGRGPLLEVLLSHVISHAPSARIVAMSATVPNPDELADWLDGGFFAGTARPVELSERIADPGDLQGLVEEITSREECVLVFCGTKRRAEEVAHQLHTMLKGIPVAFHHAGLGAEQREAVERGFLSRKLKVLTATTTLATGVNLPARRVIVNTTMVGNQPLTPVQFKQMAGRAGRTGMGGVGDAVLLVAGPAQAWAEKVLLGALSGRIESRVLSDDAGDHLLRGVLGYVCGKDGGADESQVEGYVRYALLAGFQDSTAMFGSRAVCALGKLEELGMVTRKDGGDSDNNNGKFAATDVGWATFVSTLPVAMAKGVLDDLDLARREGVVLVDQLHLLYLISPFDRLRNPDWAAFERAFSRFSPSQAKIAARVGVSRQYVACRAHSGFDAVESPALRSARRLWVALMLQEIVDEADIETVSATYGYDRGGIEELQTRAAAFGSMIAEFAENVGFGDLAGLFESLHVRVAFGAKRDAMVLCQIPRVGGKRARALVSLGLKTVGDVATADADYVAERLKATAPGGLGPHGAATMRAIVKAARTMLQQELAAVEAAFV